MSGLKLIIRKIQEVDKLIKSNMKVFLEKVISINVNFETVLRTFK